MLGPGYLACTTFAVIVVALVAWRVLAAREPPFGARHLPRIVMMGALIVGTCSHIENVLRAGWMPLPEQPIAFNVYWTSLTALDPIAAVLLLLRPRTGLVLTAAIMASDVSINTVAFGRAGFPWPLATQLGFALFVATAFRHVWRTARPVLGARHPARGADRKAAPDAG